ncbi:hypothetical protein CTAYLR_005528 [Chrysophaeum taylorii]|uniref:MI domain-containing protein n=1 Tax=Chrysophaeum taylorii TaxID=2483200 RepID=A0AAD7U4Q3_9STRA|nr:hypothetical protein CTAYLR_005528 [Chrysophaeum taylorii]
MLPIQMPVEDEEPRRGGRRPNSQGRGPQRAPASALGPVMVLDEQPNRRRGNTKGRRGRGQGSTPPVVPAPTGAPAPGLNPAAAAWQPNQHISQFPAPPRVLPRYPYYPPYMYNQGYYYPHEEYDVELHAPMGMVPTPLQPPPPPVPPPPSMPSAAPPRPMPPPPPPPQPPAVPDQPRPPADARDGAPPDAPVVHGDKPAPPPAAVEAPTTAAVEERTTAAVEEPTTAAVEEPTTAAVEEPTPTAAVEEPTPTAAVEEPTPTAAVEEPTPTAAVEEPTPTAAVEEPPPAVEVPTAAEEAPAPAVDEEPSVDVDGEPTAARAGTEESAASSATPSEPEPAPTPAMASATQETPKPLTEPNRENKQPSPALRPAKKSLKKRAADFENRTSSGLYDAFEPTKEPEPAPEPEVAVEPEEEPAPEPASQIAENWEEEEEEMAAVETGEAVVVSPSAEEEACGRRVYSKEVLLSIRGSVDASERPPESLPSFAIEKPKEEPGRRRLGPGGTARSAPPKELDDARRPKQQALRGRNSAESDVWKRGQKVARDQAAPGPVEGTTAGKVEPLKKSAHRWDPTKLKQSADAMARAVAEVTSILNKMTPENFDKLSSQLMELEMISLDMLREVIRVLFEKAVDEPHFAVVYAQLCHRVVTEVRAWPFIKVVRDDVAREWFWVVDLKVETARLVPVEGNVDAASALLKRVVERDDEMLGERKIEEDRSSRERRRLEASQNSDEHLGNALPEAVGVGQLKLEPGDCVVREDRGLVCFLAPQQRPGVLFAVLVDASALFESEVCKVGQTGFKSREDAMLDAMKMLSFRRNLLNQCEENFKKVAGASGGETALAEMATQAMKDQEEATARARADALAKGLPPPLPPDELAHADWVVKLKRRMLGIVRFIGELFKQDLVREKHVHECFKLLLGDRRAAPDFVPDDESVEAAAKLFLTIGKRLESPAASKAKLDGYFAYLDKLAKDKRLAARTRFMLQDLNDTRRNDWRERRQKDGPHKLTNNQQKPQDSRDQLRAAQQQQQHQRARESSDARRKEQQQQQQRRLAPDVRILPRGEPTANPPPAAATKEPQQRRPEWWSKERMENRIASILDEYAEMRDDKELLESYDELPPAAAALTVGIAVEKHIIEGKEKQRAAAYATLLALVAADRLRRQHLESGLAPVLEALYDLAVDVPKVYDWVAALAAQLLLCGVLDPAWLKANVLPADDPEFAEELLPHRQKFFAILVAELPRQQQQQTVPNPKRPAPDLIPFFES